MDKPDQKRTRPLDSLVAFPEPPAGILTEAQEIAWSLEALKPYLNFQDVARTNASYHQPSHHLSPLQLELWIDGDLSDKELLDHVASVGAHYTACPRCHAALAWYSQRKGYAMDIQPPD